jgi:Fe-Mn family superoxide dismutase
MFSRSSAVVSGARRALASAAGATRLQHTLPELPYAATALEPVISGEIMELHHKKHHATYVNNLNAAKEQLQSAMHSNDVHGLIAIQRAIKFNGGGHINHSIFWNNLCPDGGGLPSGDLLEAIERDFGSFDIFHAEMTAKTVAVEGSGWGWLGYEKGKDRLVVTTCANQDPLQATTGLIPMLGIDVWEHAYYLQYKNVRPEYVNKIWDVVNWADVARRLSDAQ